MDHRAAFAMSNQPVPGRPRTWPRTASVQSANAALDGLPLLSATSPAWAQLAASNLSVFLADHAVCEQQAALTALNLVACYPDDEALVERMTSLAVEEVIHLRRVSEILRRRGMRPARRRTNPWVRDLRERITRDDVSRRKTDRLLVAALIEARSCERFTCLLGVLTDRDPEVAALLRDLGPAEKRHWEMFYGLAERGQPGEDFRLRWQAWLEFEAEISGAGGRQATVHG